MKRLWFFGLSTLAVILLLYVSFGRTGTITKGNIGKEDMGLWNGTSSMTFERLASTGYTLTMHSVDWPGVDVLQVYGGGVARTGGVISSAVTAIGSNPAQLWLSPGTWTISADLSIPSTLALNVPAGAILSVGAGQTLTINGPIIAGSYQIFSGSGTVTLAGEALDFRLGAWSSGGTGIRTTDATLGSGANVNEFSIDGTMAGNSDAAVPTEKAVKTYVDAASTTQQAYTDTKVAWTYGTGVSTATGTTSVEISSSLPSTVTEVELMLFGVSLSGSSTPCLQLGDAGGYETSGYLAGAGQDTSAGGNEITDTASLPLFGQGLAASEGIYGVVRLVRDTSLGFGRRWFITGTLYDGTQNVSYVAGMKATSDTLTSIQIKSKNGTDTFDGGSVSIRYK
jgi:hypothetical protein